MCVDRDQVERILTEHLERDSRVAAAYLFGSFATGTARPDSDVDVGVLYLRSPGHRLLDQPFSDEAALAERLGRRVEIVVMNGAPPDLVHRILRANALLFERDRSRRIAFEVQARNEYFDLLPILHQYRNRPTP